MTEHHKLRVVTVPSGNNPIKPAPGFLKKSLGAPHILADDHIEMMKLCGAGCRYCSSNDGNVLRMQREPLATLTEEQLGERLLPASSPELVMVYPELVVAQKLDEQLRQTSRWNEMGKGKTLVVSMLTDAFSPPVATDGTTRAVIEMLLARTSYRLRILTKFSRVASEEWIELWRAHKDRVVIGLSTGTNDDAWAKRIEVNTSLPSHRLTALRRLQDEGIPTFGMMCPVFPDMLEGDALERLLGEMRPSACETVWFEPYNSRGNWREVQAGYEVGSAGWNWLLDVFGHHKAGAWSRYALELYLRVRAVAERDGWVDRMAYLLYEGGVTKGDAAEFPADLRGVVLQSKPDPKTGRSTHYVFAEKQKALGIGSDAPAAIGPLFARSAS